MKIKVIINSGENRISFIFVCLFVCLFVCFTNIILIGHLMQNQFKENKSEKKFKGEVLMINFR